MSTTHSFDPPPAATRLLRTAVVHLQDRLAAAFGVAPAGREATVVNMLGSSAGAAAGYWLQLMLAMGIASLGLALGSTAVVIGAMLISPLMGPIVAFGMGLAVGSPLLVMRSFVRTAASVVAVVVAAALLMRALPFNQVTPEIAARTSPTALDLLVAVFCALAAAYTTMRPSSETTATAAGTAIGIALVPPLCVVGFGIGTGSRAIASGAGLLFTANFCAILLFAVLSFLLLGYSSVSVATLEDAELTRHARGPTAGLARGLRFLFGLRYGALLRVLMPLLLLAAVFFPLREALWRVSWQVRVSAQIQTMLAQLPQATVRSSVSVDGGRVAVRLLTLGKAEDAARLERDLREKIAAVSGTLPKVEVIAVPDAAALEQVAAIIKTEQQPIEVVRKEPDLELLRRSLSGALARTWPADAGELLTYRVELGGEAPAIVEVVHIGAELGAPGATLLAQDLSQHLGTKVAVRDLAFSKEPLAAPPEAGLTWLPQALSLLWKLDSAPGLHACIEVPPAPKARHNRGHHNHDQEVVAAALRAARASRDARIDLREGASFELAVSTGACTGNDGAPDAGASDGGAGNEE